MPANMPNRINVPFTELENWDLLGLYRHCLSCEDNTKQMCICNDTKYNILVKTAFRTPLKIAAFRSK